MTDRDAPPPRARIPRRNTVAVTRRVSASDDLRALLGARSRGRPSRPALLKPPRDPTATPSPSSGERAMERVLPAGGGGGGGGVVGAAAGPGGDG